MRRNDGCAAIDDRLYARSQSEVAELLGVSREAVGQVERRALRKLQQNPSLLAEFAPERQDQTK